MVFLPETIILTDTIQKGATHFTSKQLSYLKRTPFKIYVAFVTTRAFSGHKNLNPFDFRRHWVMPDGEELASPVPAPLVDLDGCSSPEDSSSEESDSSDKSFHGTAAVTQQEILDEMNISDLSDKSLNKISKKGLMSKFRDLVGAVGNFGSTASDLHLPSGSVEVRAKGSRSRGSRQSSRHDGSDISILSHPRSETGEMLAPDAEISVKVHSNKGRKESIGKQPSLKATPSVRPKVRAAKAQKKVKVDPYTSNGGDPDLLDPNKKYCYIKQVELNLNGMEKKVLNGLSTKHHCFKDFIRFMEAQNNYRTNQTEGISYDMYNSNFYFSAFDLTTGVFGGDINNMKPSVPEMDQMRLNVTLSDAIPQETTMIITCCYSNAIQLNPNGSVNISYLNRVN